MYIKRKIEILLGKAIKQFPVLLVTGPRQAGKSTLLKHFFKKYNYVTLDDPQTRQMALEDPELFLANYSPPIIIDEIQYAPILLSYIKIDVDLNRRKYGRYILSGSQTFQIMAGVAESLAGRIAIFHLYPFSWQEVEEIPKYRTASIKEENTAKQIIKGFYPEYFVNSSLDHNLWASSYFSTYIERDVRSIKTITDLNRFQTFINLLAVRVGQLLNLNEISKECGISQPTAKSWLTILESTYVIYLLKPFHNNRSKRLIKSPKLYFVDTGLLCYLLGIDISSRFMKARERGPIFENMIIMDAIKQSSYQKTHSDYFFYRTASGIEIDLVIETRGKFDIYEIKFAKTLDKSMANALVQFREEHPVQSAQILSFQKKSYTIAKGIKTEHWTKIFK